MLDEIAAIARIVHEANRAYCVTLGDMSQPSWDEAPQWQRLSAENGVEKVLRGEVTTPEQSHESWLAFKEADGWVWGEIKNPTLKQHPCMVPYGKLPAEQRTKDALFFAIIHAYQGER